MFAHTYLLDVRPVDKATLEPILFLLESPDIEVQRAASAALGNLAVDGMNAARSKHANAALLTTCSPKQSTNRFPPRTHSPHSPDELTKCLSTMQRCRMYHKPGNT